MLESIFLPENNRTLTFATLIAKATQREVIVFLPCHVHPQSGQSQQRCLAESHPFILIELIAGRDSPIMITYLPSNGVYKRDVSKQIREDGDREQNKHVNIFSDAWPFKNTQPPI